MGTNVTGIGVSAFDACYRLASVTLDTNLTSIGGFAFAACYSLTNVAIPESVISIGAGAFNYWHQHDSDNGEYEQYGL